MDSRQDQDETLDTGMEPLPEPAAKLANTRLLKLPVSVGGVTPRATGPLDRSVPWVLEFRIVGTAQTLQTQVQNQMILGRRSDSPTTGAQADVDLGSYNGFALGVSRNHATVFVKNERLMIKDLSSTNGTRLNDGLCEAGRDYRLHHGDEVTLGRLKMQIHFAFVPVHDTQTHMKATPRPLIESVEIPQIGNGTRVLIIEDDPDVGAVFALALEQADYQVVLVNDVARGLGLITSQMPELILVDAMLHDMNGLDLVRYVRKQPGGRQVAIIVTSSATAGYHRGQAIDAGADEFLGQPVSVDDLLQVVQGALSSRK